MSVVTLQPVSPTSAIFQPDQVLDFTVDFWDTPFAALEGDTASYGIPADIRQPTSTGLWTVKTNLDAATASNAKSTFLNNSYSSGIVTGGRVPTLINYWAGGAPAQHGGAFVKQIAYHFSCTLRGVPGREWWSTGGSVTFCLAYAGCGYVRVTKTVGGVTSDVTYKDTTGTSVALKRQITEGLYLQNGLMLSDPITLATGDTIDIYYINDISDDWGGFVFKAVAGATPTTAQVNQAPVIGCDIFDTGTTPTKRTLNAITSVDIHHQLGAPSTADVTIGLVNTTTTDGVGWNFVRSSGTDPGYLVYNDGTGTTYQVRRGRLIRVKAGFQNEQYIAFTGFLDDFGDVQTDGTLTLRLVGFAQRLVDQFCKNYPDKISYMAVGYKQITGINEPVYDITAFDNWPIEYAIRELVRRGGVPDSTSFQQLAVRNSDGTAPAITMAGETYYKVWARTAPVINEGSSTTASVMTKIERPVHYGNAGRGFNPAYPHDDAYLFGPDNKTDLWSQARTFADKYGFELRFDILGHLVVQTLNNPHATWDFNTNFGQSPTLKKAPNAFNGTYLEWTNTVNAVTKSVTAARIDVVVPLGVNHGSWAYTVKNAAGVTVASGTINPSLAAGSADQFYYDYFVTSTCTNSTVFTLYSGDYATYTVILQSSGTGTLTRRLDGFLLWHTDPFKPRLAYALSTTQNALTVRAQGIMHDARNLVYVVGRRKATVTDSTKFFDVNENPANPEAEFIVQVGVDAGSIVDPTASNYLGYPKESVIYDTQITDDDFAGYVARTFISKYRIPRPAATIEHTALPMLEVREPVYAAETVYSTLDSQSVLWVTTVTHTLRYGKFTTEVSCTSYPPAASYELRKDVDIDTYYGGSPVANVQVSYTSLANSAVVNAGPTDEYVSGDSDIVNVTNLLVQAGSPEYLDMTGYDWPPVDGTVFIRPNQGAATDDSTLATWGLTLSWQTLASLANPADGTTTVLGSAYLKDLASIKSVVLRIYKTTENDTEYLASSTTLTTTQPSAIPSNARYYYTVDLSSGLVSIRAVRPDTRGMSPNYHPHTLPGHFKSATVLVTYYRTNSTNRKTWVANNPYHHFMNVDFRTGASQRRIYLPWNQLDKGTGTTPNASRNTNVKGYDVRYRRFGPVDGSHNFSDPYGGTSPFYDPYTSELGYLVTVQFDALVSGLYRISIRNTDDDTIVAWLTDPSNDPTDIEQHWTYVTAGVSKQLTWDGVDDVGGWNRVQSQIYGAAAAGAFEQVDQPIIGKGFYVWNRELDQNGGFGSLALIAGTVDARNKPVFGHQPYAKWYVKFEAKNEALIAIAAANETTGGSGTSSLSIPRVLNTGGPSSNMDPTIHSASIKVSSTVTSSTNNTLVDSAKAWRTNQWVGYQVRITSGTGNGQLKKIVSNTATALTIAPSTTDPNIWTVNPPAASAYQIESPTALVYTHLPNPTMVEISQISDYINATAYNDANPPTTDVGNWQDTPQTDAVFNNQKPIRIRFNVQARPGVLWSGNEQKAAIRLYRTVHMRVHIFDQFLVYTGSYYPRTSVEAKTLVNRRLTNDDHTIVYGDDTWIQGLNFKQSTSGSGYEWVFLPRYFRKNFRGVDNESIQFNDYLQLEEVPKWSSSRVPNAPRSRLHFALMNYLFFMSAYTQDRSGRYVWCLNRKFIDRSKILNNDYADWWDPNSVTTPPAAASSTTYRNTWPDDPNTQFRRSVIVRQWQDEGTWRTDQNTLWSFGGPGSLGYELLRHKFSCHDPSATQLNSTNWSSFTGLKTDYHSKWHSDDRIQLPSIVGNNGRNMGDILTTNVLGKWTWESAPFWVPNITRDFHGFYMLPPMIDKVGSTDPAGKYIYLQVDGRGYNGDDNTGDDTAATLQWNSPVWDMTTNYDISSAGLVRFWPGVTVNSTSGPTNNRITTAVMDYLRQDDLLHYEEIRGMYTRGPRPSEVAKRISPSSPYLSNVTQLTNLKVGLLRLQKYPHFQAFMGIPTPGVNGSSFSMSFRYEYLWESGSLFPTTQEGLEQLAYLNAYRCQMEPYSDLAAVAFDGGAWVGWKDDLSSTNNANNTLQVCFESDPDGTSRNPFELGHMPVALATFARNPDGTAVRQEMIFSLVLVNGRRNIQL